MNCVKAERIQRTIVIRGRRAQVVLTLAIVALVCAGTVQAADQPGFDQLEQQYRDNVHGIVKQFCSECHSTTDKAGELDLEQFAKLANVRRSPRSWQKVAEMLDNGEMPPKDAEQLSAADRKGLRTWIEQYLNAEAHASAGDPGRVVMRRLNNVEYTNTVRDLTGVPLSPASEFPVDGAAGEGFTNTGDSLVMSPALLTKYLDAAKEIASHAMLVPEGFRFSVATNRGDWIDELMANIRGLYARYSDGEGRPPLEAYLDALIANREALGAGSKSIAAVAAERKISPKYLDTLFQILVKGAPAAADAAGGDYPGGIIDQLRTRVRAARQDEVAGLVDLVRPWQNALWKTNAVGHFKPWHAPVDPVVAAQEVRLKLKPAADADEVVVYLAAGDAGDGATGDAVVWQQPRLESPGRPPLALRDVRQQSEYLIAQRKKILADTARYLAAVSEAQAAGAVVDVPALAAKNDLDPLVLAGWLDYLGIEPSGKIEITGHFQQKMLSSGGYTFVPGWGTTETPSLHANSSDQEAHIPGLMKPHSVAVHPSPTLAAVVGWQSPTTATVAVTATVLRAHTACGNGITWALELRRGSTRVGLASGNSEGLKVPAAGPLDGIKVRPGDVLSLAIGPRDGSHACDLTEVDLTIKTAGDQPREWQLSRDVSSDVLAGNPHADSFGNAGVWHFYTEPVSGGGDLAAVIPPDSVLARWRDATDATTKSTLAGEVEKLFTGPRPAAADQPDGLLYRQATSLSGPLVGPLAAAIRANPSDPRLASVTVSIANSGWGIDPAQFGKRADGRAIGANDLAVQAPSAIAIRLPADLVAGSDLVTVCTLDEELGREGTVQPNLSTTAREPASALLPGAPIVSREGSQARRRIAASLALVRDLFPPAVCYPRIVPVDEVVTLQLMHRDDEPLCRLMLDDAQQDQLDKLWHDLRFVSQDALKLRDSFDQLMEYATQDSDPRLFEPYREPINKGVDDFRQALLSIEPLQVERVVDFAVRAYRRPLTAHEQDELRTLYRTLRSEELSHDDATRMVLARVFVSPAFLYRVESAGPGSAPQPINDWELASRLSYFLWASTPDDELQKLAADGHLHEPDILAVQAQRLLKSDHARSLATEFACQWIEIREFDKLDEKSESTFPTFLALRGDMYEEAVRFFADLFERDGSVLDILDADYTFLNDKLAEHYGIPGVAGPEFRRVEGIRQHGRGGILGFSTALAKHSGASRTSPILRGTWLLEMVLGEKLPKPPKGVPPLPDDDSGTAGLTVRQLVEKHRSAVQCSGCHAKIDPFGFALENYDAIGRKRTKEIGDRPIDATATLPDGTAVGGMEDLRTYLTTVRKDQFLRTFCRKLLGYALGREVQLSDQPLIDDMVAHMTAREYRVSAAVDTIVRSQQFRYHRAAAAAADEQQ